MCKNDPLNFFIQSRCRLFKHFKHLPNFIISKLAQTYILQELVGGTREKIANNISDQIIKYGSLILFP